MNLPPLDPSVAATRHAVRQVLQGVDRDGAPPIVLAALSGGTDSLALVAALAFEAPRAGVAAGAVVVDHGLQEGSAAVAERAAFEAKRLGLDPVIVRRVRVERDTGLGLEAGARRERYAALEEERTRLGAACVMTAHTRDDQAEQVLLALARGSGTRAIAGIPPRREGVVRPFLGIERATTVAACEAQALRPWHDPHNQSREFARVRARTLLPVIERELGPGVGGALARSAEIAREDADALDALAGDALARCELARPGEAQAVAVERFAGQPQAIRNRMLRSLAQLTFGTSLSREQTLTVAALVTNWHGQGAIDVPGGSVVRIDGMLRFNVGRRRQ